MKINLNNNILTIELDNNQAVIMSAIHENWPHLIEEYMNMIIKNRERHLERIEVTREIQARKNQKIKENK